MSSTIYNGPCDTECDLDQSCWGPGPTDCKKCKHFLDMRTDTCVGSCNNETQFVRMRECQPCHQSCVGCRGMEEYQCLDCRGFRSGKFCVSNCGLDEFLQNKTCTKCHESCSPVGCSGPLGVEGAGGCNPCPKPVISYRNSKNDNENMFVSLSDCYSLNKKCPESYFKGRVSRNAKGKFQRIANTTACIKCHPLCLKCTEYGFNAEVCQECVELFKNCTCPRGFYFNNNQDFHWSHMMEYCKPCNEGCKECTDLNTCKKCDDKSYRLYAKGYPVENSSFVCIDSCPAEQQFSYYNEHYGKYCSSLNNDLLTDGNMYLPFGSILIIICLILIALLKRFSNKIKTYKRKIKVDQPLEESGYSLESDDTNFSRAKLRIIKESDVRKTDILGSGAFGTVYMATLNSEDGLTQMAVAVKVLSPQNKDTSTKAFLQEASIMACVDHPNLLRLLAVCVTSNVMLVTQLMPLGDLVHYLRNHNQNIQSTTLLEWCKQIAEGMAFLEEHRLVHRDLAARNVLMQSENLVKVTDFGLSRALDRDEEVYSSRGGKLPVKWLALECLKQGIFTHKSDMWAFGVTVWEILTFGEEPYGEKTFQELVEFLDSGERLQQPENCTAGLLYVLMTCWAANAQERPSFKEIVEKFSGMVRDSGHFITTGNLRNDSTSGSLPQNYYHGIDYKDEWSHTSDGFSIHDYVNV